MYLPFTMKTVVNHKTKRTTYQLTINLTNKVEFPTKILALHYIQKHVFPQYTKEECLHLIEELLAPPHPLEQVEPSSNYLIISFTYKEQELFKVLSTTGISSYFTTQNKVLEHIKKKYYASYYLDHYTLQQEYYHHLLIGE